MELPVNLAKQSAEAFLDTFVNLYEHSPWFVERSLPLVIADEKYNSLEKFHELLSNIMLNADSNLQDNLIVAHPTLAGKKAQNNREYFAKFDFPFIMAVKEKNKSYIISQFKERKDNSKNQERSNALDEINKIAWLRIKEIYGI
jgi:2-oxo-4-hydroxy-4-carboxy-5-ureidoimidazoline decarboxylase